MIASKNSQKPCFLCGTTRQTVEARFKDGTFSGVLCKDHLFERMEAKLGQAAEPRRPASASKTRATDLPAERPPC